MKHVIGAILAILTVMNMAHAEDTPAVVNEVLAQIVPTIERDKADFLKRVKLQNEHLIQLLQKAEERAAKAGRLDDAVALKKELDLARTGALIETLMKPEFPNSGSNFVKKVAVYSAGFNVGCKAKITINGVDVVDTESRGLTLYAVKNGQQLLLKTYDTFLDKSQGAIILKDVSALPQGTLLIAAACDDATQAFTEEGQKALRLAGAKKGLMDQPYRCSYVLITIIGGNLIYEKISETAPVKFPEPEN